jgi:hypothetical protein
MNIALKNHNGFCGTPVYTITRTKVAGAAEGCEWSFNFSYADGQANVYAWVVLEGVEDEIEFVIAEDDNITHEGVVKFWEAISKNVLKQAAFVLAALPDHITAWRAQNAEEKPPKKSIAERITVVGLSIDDAGDNERGVPCVYFSILVDGKSVSMSHEWLDVEGDVVSYGDRNNTAWPEVFEQVADALGGEQIDAVHNAIIQSLAEALEQRPTSKSPMGKDVDAMGDEFDEHLEAEVLR